MKSRESHDLEDHDHHEGDLGGAVPEGATPGYPPGTEEYPSDADERTPGYPPGTERYPSGDGSPLDPAYGSETKLDRLLRERQQVEDEVQGRTGRWKMDAAGGWIPGQELEEEEGQPLVPAKLNYRQVGVKLSASQYQELRHAAELYGVAPTTLARMMVNRGTRAILDADRREAVFGREAD